MAAQQARIYQMVPEEVTLLERCLRQDRLAQKELYDKYKDAMYTLCYRITSDFELAQDALQEAFVGVFRGLDKFRKQSSLGAWIKTIVVRTAYRKVKQQNQIYFEDIDNVPDNVLLDWGEYIVPAYLEQAIQSLPPGYRSVFVLVEIEGYSHKEVAEMLGISVGTSKSQLYHSKRQLQKKLRAWGENR
ncbi:MAG: RNA polymerase sigma factor [Bacteroidota bacterium]